MHYFQNWKVKKYRQQKNNKLLQKILNDIEKLAEDELLAEMNAEAQEIIMSDDEEEEEPRLPVPGLDGAEVRATCEVCRMGDEDHEEMNFFSFECGHEFCDRCANQLLSVSAPCPECRSEMKGMRRMYHNLRYVVKATQQPSKPVPRVLTLDERRQENVLLMQRRPYQPVLNDLPSDDEVEVILETAGKQLDCLYPFIYLLLHYLYTYLVHYKKSERTLGCNLSLGSLTMCMVFKAE